MKSYEDISLLDYLDMENTPMMEKARLFKEYSEETKHRGHYNFRRVSYSGSGAVMMVRDPRTGVPREMINFASNDYLHLTKHPKTIKAGIEAVQKYGTGAGSVPLLGGTLDIHEKLEKISASFKGCDDALIYSSGFGSNCGTLLSMLNEKDVAILDILDHASIIDGCKNTNIRYFKHNDMDSLEKVLQNYCTKFRTRLIIVDGVYSMDGDIARLDRIVELAGHYRAIVMVDEAHATGVIGENGRGTPEHFHLEGKVDIVAGTFSKALGAVGGFIASSADLIEYIRFYSRPYIFSTAMTPQAAGSLIAAFEVIETEPHLRERLWENITYFKQNLLEMNCHIGNSETAIFPVIIGDDYKVKEACRLLHEAGIYASPVLYPAVKKRDARLRFSVTASHTTEHLDRALEALRDTGKKLGIV